MFIKYKDRHSDFEEHVVLANHKLNYIDPDAFSKALCEANRCACEARKNLALHICSTDSRNDKNKKAQRLKTLFKQLKAWTPFNKKQILTGVTRTNGELVQTPDLQKCSMN